MRAPTPDIAIQVEARRQAHLPFGVGPAPTGLLTSLGSGFLRPTDKMHDHPAGFNISRCIVARAVVGNGMFLQHRKHQTLGEAADELGDGPDPRSLTVAQIRRRSDAKLLIAPDGWNLGPAVRAVVAAEQRRREVWSGPAGKAFWILIASLIVAIGSAAAQAL